MKRYPGLTVLTRDYRSSDRYEILQYLEGRHPAFQINQSNIENFANEISKKSPVIFSSSRGKIGATHFRLTREEDEDTRLRLLSACRKHCDNLLFEAEEQQLSHRFIERLTRYRDVSGLQDLSFVELDAAMSFIKGSVGEKYFRKSVDGGFYEACTSLVMMHKELRRYFLPDPEEIPGRISDSVNKQDVDQLVESAIDIVADANLRMDVDVSTIEAIQSLREYTLYLDDQKSGARATLTTAVKVAVAMLSALAAVATVHTWAASQVGILFISKIKTLLEAFLNLLA